MTRTSLRETDTSFSAQTAQTAQTAPTLPPAIAIGLRRRIIAPSTWAVALALALLVVLALVLVTVAVRAIQSAHKIAEAAPAQLIATETITDAQAKVRTMGTPPAYTYYDAWKNADDSLPVPNATVLRQESMTKLRSLPTSPIEWSSGNHCYNNTSGYTCGCSSYTPQGNRDDFNCDNVLDVNYSVFSDDAVWAMCPYRGMIGDVATEGQNQFACNGMARTEQDTGSGACGCWPQKTCSNKSFNCTVSTWNVNNQAACCAGVVDTYYTQNVWEKGTNQVKLTCDPSWYVGSDVCNALFATECFGPTVTQAALSADLPHPLLFNGATFPCNDYYSVIRAWMQMGNSDGAAAATAIAQEVLRFCGAEGRSDPSCAGVVHDYQLPA